MEHWCSYPLIKDYSAIDSTLPINSRGQTNVGTHLWPRLCRIIPPPPNTRLSKLVYPGDVESGCRYRSAVFRWLLCYILRQLHFLPSCGTFLTSFTGSNSNCLMIKIACCCRKDLTWLGHCRCCSPAWYVQPWCLTSEILFLRLFSVNMGKN